MRIIRLSLFVVLALSATSCLSVGAGERVIVGEPTRNEWPVKADTTVIINLPHGEVEFKRSGGDRLIIETAVLCPQYDNNCVKKVSDFRVNGNLKDNRLEINKNKSLPSTGTIRTTVSVPSVSHVFIDFYAGELTLEPLSACVTVKQFAGNVNAQFNKNLLASLEVDSNFGSASINGNNVQLNGGRTWLVGDKLLWTSGKGDCNASIQLGAGEITAELVSL